MYSERLTFLRERLGITQIAISKIIGIENTTYSDYEKENKIIPLKHLITICNYFNVSLDYIFNFTQKKQYQNVNKALKDKTEIGKKLKEWRKERKITQVEIAKVLSTTHSVISDYERGRYFISTLYLYSICKTYKVSADYLLGRTNKKTWN